MKFLIGELARRLGRRASQKRIFGGCSYEKRCLHYHETGQQLRCDSPTSGVFLRSSQPARVKLFSGSRAGRAALCARAPAGFCRIFGASTNGSSKSSLSSERMSQIDASRDRERRRDPGPRARSDRGPIKARRGPLRCRRCRQFFKFAREQ